MYSVLFHIRVCVFGVSLDEHTSGCVIISVCVCLFCIKVEPVDQYICHV